jgi:hypothetical protein
MTPTDTTTGFDWQEGRRLGLDEWLLGGLQAAAALFVLLYAVAIGAFVLS